MYAPTNGVPIQLRQKANPIHVHCHPFIFAQIAHVLFGVRIAVPGKCRLWNGYDLLISQFHLLGLIGFSFRLAGRTPLDNRSGFGLLVGWLRT